ncbi:MAG: ATP-binding cassette domain-containing protein [Sphaerochaetaceae bacterium]
MSQRKTVLLVDSITKRFGEKQVLSNISFSLSSDRIIGLLGPNGAGKTTLFKIMNNLVGATEGRITLDGRPIEMTDIGFVFEGVRHFYWPLSVKENYYYLSSLKGTPRKTVLHYLENDARFEVIQPYWTTPFGTLSTGQKQLVATLQALIPSPRILCLDEPSNGLDIHHIESLSNILELSRPGKIILASSHDIGFLHSFVDSFIVLNKGNIVQNITNENTNYEEVYTTYATCIGEKS